MVRRLIAWLLLALAGFVPGYVVFWCIGWLIDQVWGTGGVFGGFPPLWAMLLIPVLAGAVVAVLRQRQNGHNPLAGLAMGPVRPSDYPYLLGAVVASLVGGLVLGPEVALLFTGGVVGTVLGPRLGVSIEQAATVSGVGALLALFVGPALGGSTTPAARSLTMAEVALALAAAVLAVLMVSIARWIGRALGRWRPDDAVRPAMLIAGGLVVGGLAAGYQAWSGESARLVLTSGEGMVRPLLTISSVALLFWTVGVKLLAYGISMGVGFRGGPYFPAMFAGAGAGAIIAVMAGVSPFAAATAGMIAAVTNLAQLKWVATVVVGLVVGALLGGPWMVPTAVAGALIGRLIPRLDPASPSAQHAGSHA